MHKSGRPAKLGSAQQHMEGSSQKRKRKTRLLSSQLAASFSLRIGSVFFAGFVADAGADVVGAGSEMRLTNLSLRPRN